MEHRVLICAPTGKDAWLITQVLERAGLECLVGVKSAEIIEELARGAGALFVADEALTSDFLKSLTGYLRNQPTWSDMPILVLSKRGLDSTDLRNIYLALGNVTLLERPVQSVTLVTAATSALRARRRQYEMREIDRRKDEFLAMLAHELRNPLAPIGAASDLLRFAQLDRARIQQTSEIISRQVRHMTGLIDDLLDVSRVSRGLVTLERTVLDARHIAANAMEQVRPLIDSRRHRLTLNTPPGSAFIEGDQKRMIQIVTNLLNNAAKYTPEGGNIALTIDANDKNVIFTVSDNGIGMAQDVIDHVFEMFTQAQRTPDRSQGGLGIGLALVKSLVELHRGAVSAYSHGTGKGSRFVVTLPRISKPVTSRAPNERDAELIPAKGRRLLLVDDNVDAAQMLAMFLETAGHEIMIEHSAKNAIERARVSLPHACLLDIGLPDMDGNELARHLRRQPGTERSMLIAITGYGQEQDRKKSNEAGFNHHFVKPVNMEELLRVLDEIAD